MRNLQQRISTVHSKTYMVIICGAEENNREKQLQQLTEQEIFEHRCPKLEILEVGISCGKCEARGQKAIMATMI
jgi:hypothetical protein